MDLVFQTQSLKHQGSNFIRLTNSTQVKTHYQISKHFRKNTPKIQFYCPKLNPPNTRKRPF